MDRVPETRSVIDATFWRGRRVLLTGHTGFKGSWLALWLERLGADVTGIALKPGTSPNLFELARVADGLTSHLCDVRDNQAVVDIVREANPEVVFHLAAQPLVRASYRQPLETYTTNVIGTANVLDALRGVSSARVAVMVTTDKVYRNREWVHPYRECDALGGHDPYSASKAASEIVISSYRDAFLAHQGVAVASARAGNVIGGGDWSEDRLIPDAIRAWQANRTLEIRRPDAIRPWQHVLDPLSGYLVLAQCLWHRPDLAGAYNFGPSSAETASVRAVVDAARSAYEGASVSYAERDAGPHEAGLLALDTSKAWSVLGVRPRWGLRESVLRTMSWYRANHRGDDARKLCGADFAAYEASQ